jgi:transposase-like protein
MDHRPGPDLQVAARPATSVNPTHSNAPLTPEGRRRLAALVVDDGWTLRRAAERFQCSPSTAFRWTQRYHDLEASFLIKETGL